MMPDSGLNQLDDQIDSDFWGNRSDKILIWGCISFRHESDLIIHMWFRHVLPVSDIHTWRKYSLVSVFYQTYCLKSLNQSDHQVDLSLNQASCLNQACKIVGCVADLLIWFCDAQFLTTSHYLTHDTLGYIFCCKKLAKAIINSRIIIPAIDF